ncbi:MAG: hypothetical protein ACR2PO_04090 [Methyloligellaceae bacterium]
MDALSHLMQREVFIALAVGGAIIATIGSYLLHSKTVTSAGTARFILRFGYAISFASVVLFIAAGFASGW